VSRASSLLTGIEWLNAPVNHKLNPLAGACARLKGFGFPAAGGASAFACRDRSRTIIRIHSGSADRPLRKSS